MSGYDSGLELRRWPKQDYLYICHFSHDNGNSEAFTFECASDSTSSDWPSKYIFWVLCERIEQNPLNISTKWLTENKDLSLGRTITRSRLAHVNHWTITVDLRHHYTTIDLYARHFLHSSSNPQEWATQMKDHFDLGSRG